MNSGCIFCSLVGDFGKALNKVMSEYTPDRIIIEPSGVGKLSDIVAAVNDAHLENAVINSASTVVDAGKCKIYMKNFGEFFNNQIKSTKCIILSHTSQLSEEKLAATLALIREQNEDAVVITTDWNKLTGAQILSAIEQNDTMTAYLKELAAAVHDDDDDDDDECECHHHHHHDDDDDDEHEHEHHHHDDDDDDDEHEHHHHDDDDDECECHHHHHDDDEDGHEHHHHHHHHHGEHDADEVFTSWGVETAKKYTKADLTHILTEIQNEEKYGKILRAKGILPASDSENWIHFDYVPGEPDIRSGAAIVTGRICVIGAELNEKAISELFGV